MQPNVVKAYVQLLYDYHPELVPAELAPSGA
jgi:hypothetical protein